MGQRKELKSFKDLFYEQIYISSTFAKKGKTYASVLPWLMGAQCINI